MPSVFLVVPLKAYFSAEGAAMINCSHNRQYPWKWFSFAWPDADHSVRVLLEDWLVRNAPEDNVIQQSDLFSQLHRWERLKALCLRTVRLNTQMEKETGHDELCFMTFESPLEMVTVRRGCISPFCLEEMTVVADRGFSLLTQAMCICLWFPLIIKPRPLTRGVHDSWLFSF